MAVFDRLILKRIWRLSIPLVFGAIMSTIVTVMDGLFLIRYSIHAFNTIILIIPIVSLVTSIASGLAVAIVESLGTEKDSKRYMDHIIICVFLSVLVAIVITLAAYISPQTFANLVGLNSGTNLHSEYAWFFEYWYWIVPSFIFQMLLIPGIQVLIFFNRIKESNIILLALVVINLVLAPVFIFSFRLGVMGAAIATDISYFISLISLFAFGFRRYKGLLKFPFQHIKLLDKKSKQMLLQQVKTAGIIFCSISTFVIGSILLNNLATSLGTAALLVTGASEQMKSFFALPTRAVTSSYLLVFYESLSNRATAEYKSVYWAATVIIGCLYGVAILSFIFIPGFFIYIYGFEDQMLIANFRYILFISGITLFLNIFTRASQVGFLGLGHSYALFLQSVFTVGIGYLLSRYLSNLYGVRGIIDGQLLSTCIVTLIGVTYFYKLLQRRIVKDRINN